MDELIKRLEAAKEGSRELDLDISELLGAELGLPGTTAQHMDLRAFQKRNNRLPFDDIAMRWLPHFTESIDAALTLVPEHFSAEVHVGPGGIYNTATVYEPVKGEDDQGRRTTTYKPYEATPVQDGTVHQNTPALALCIAALKARGR